MLSYLTILLLNNLELSYFFIWIFETVFYMQDLLSTRERPFSTCKIRFPHARPPLYTRELVFYMQDPLSTCKASSLHARARFLHVRSSFHTQGLFSTRKNPLSTCEIHFSHTPPLRNITSSGNSFIHISRSLLVTPIPSPT